MLVPMIPHHAGQPNYQDWTLPRFDNCRNVEMTTLRECARSTEEFFKRSRLLRNDLAVLPDVNGGPVGARGLAGRFRGAAQGTADGLCEVLGCSFSVDSFHGPRSSIRGLTPELSYTVQASAKRR